MACHLTTLASSKANVRIAIGVPFPAPPKYDVETGIAALWKDSQPRPKGEEEMEKRRRAQKGCSMLWSKDCCQSICDHKTLSGPDNLRP